MQLSKTGYYVKPGSAVFYIWQKQSHNIFSALLLALLEDHQSKKSFSPFTIQILGKEKRQRVNERM